MSSLKNASLAWPRAIYPLCGGRGTINSCALKNCRISEPASWTCARPGNSHWRRLPVSSEEGAGQAAGGLVLRTVATLAAAALWVLAPSLIVTANSEPVAYGD